MRSSRPFAFEPFPEAPGGGSVTAAARPVSAADAGDVLAAAHAEAEAIRAAAREEGFREGHEAGRAAGRDELAASAAALAEAAAAVGAERLRVAEAVEAQAVELALRVAEKALAGTLAVQPERVVDVVQGALRGLLERERVAVLVHPEDLEIVRGATQHLVSGLGGIGHLDVQAERRVQRGGAVVRTSLGEVDARLETKLERARGVFAEALAETGGR